MMSRAPVVEEESETIESVQNKLWLALPTIIQLREAAAAAAVTGTTERKGTDDNDDPQVASVADPTDGVQEAMIPLADLQQLARCLFMACYTNPVEEDVQSGVEALLEILDKEKTLYSQDDFIQLLREVESRWLEWPDMEKKWLALSEKRHVDVLKELVQCVTQDVEPFALLAQQQVLLMQSTVVHTTELTTPFESFFDFVSPRELPVIYDTLWELLTQNAADPAVLTLEGFTVFFKWLYLHIFSNATEEAAGVVARAVWLDHLNAKAVMTRKHFVEACRCVCRTYGVVGGDVQCLENFYRNSEKVLKEAGKPIEGIMLFQQRGGAPEPPRMLIDPNDLYAPEELDEDKQEMELYAKDISANRIILCGKRGVGKTTVGKALAKRLNCIYLSVEELAAAAVTGAGRGDELGVELAQYVDRNLFIPLHLLSAVVRRRLSADDVLYRGYVFSDFPAVYDLESVDRLQFFKDCGILDLFIPNVLVNISCDDRFYPERVEATLAERKSLYREELELRGVVEEEEARRTATAGLMERLQGVVMRYKEMAAEDPSTIEPEELESTRVAATEAESELEKVIEEQNSYLEEESRMASHRAARDKRIKDLTLTRLVDTALAGGDERGDMIPMASLPGFQVVEERLRALDRCMTVGCTSTVEDSVSYIVNTLLLRPCALPLSFSDIHQNETEGGLLVAENAEYGRGESIVANESHENAGEMEKLAAEMGATRSGRWKFFCPVTFAESGVLLEGTAEYSCVFRQQHYYLASAEKLVKFKANPPVYLRAMPLNREPILLLSTMEKRDIEQLPPGAVEDLIDALHQQLRLTPVDFNDFVERWKKYRNLKKMRGDAFSARMTYEDTERKLRADRLKKRMKMEQKKRKKAPNPTPQAKRGKKGGKNTFILPEPETEFSGWEKETDKPETADSRLEKCAKELIDRRKLFVPVLVHTLRGMPSSDFDQLLEDGILPRTVLVLQYEQPQTDENDGVMSLTQGEVEGGEIVSSGENEAISLIPQLEALNRLMGISQGRGTGDSSVSQNFVVHHFVVNGKDTRVLTTEILQAVCPGMPPVEDGTVDEDLEIKDEEGVEDEEEGDTYEIIDPAVRPGKRFLNQFGSRLQYCPVTFYEKRLLVRGLNEFCVQYQKKLYVFVSEEAKEVFQRNPQCYLQIPPPYVPPRVWMIGFSKSGKKTLARALQEKYNVPFFQYNREFFEQCIEAARTPGGKVVAGIMIPEHTVDNPYLTLAESILKGIRDFAEEQERCLKERQNAEAVMEKRAQEEGTEEEEEEEEVDEEAEARLKACLEFEPEDDEDRELRLSEAYLKMASCITRIEPFESQGYMMICPHFSEGDLVLLFENGGIPEVVLQLEITEEVYYSRNRVEQLSPPSTRSLSHPEVTDVERKGDADDVVIKKWLESEHRRKERELRKWRRRHIGRDDPESDSGDENGDESFTTGANAAKGGDDKNDADRQASVPDRGDEWEALREFHDVISERYVPIVVLNGDLSESAVLRSATRKLFKVFEHRRSLLQVAEVISFENAIRMLKSGEANLSYFGYNDSVSLYDTRRGVRRVCKWMPDDKRLDPEPKRTTTEGARGVEDGEPAADVMSVDGDTTTMEVMGEDLELSATLKSPSAEDSRVNYDDGEDEEEEVEEMSEEDADEMEEIREAIAKREKREWLHRCQRVALFANRLYFFDSDASLSRYLKDPLLFVQQPPPLPPPLSRSVISIYGTEDRLSENQEVGIRKRGFAEHIAFNLGLLFISLPKLLSWAAVHRPMLSMSKRAIDAAMCGTADDALVAELLAHRLNAADVRLKGAVLFNLPRTPNQYRLLTEGGVRVDKVFHFGEVYTDVVSLMKSSATVEPPFSFSQFSTAALTEITKYMDEFSVNEGRLVLGRIRGFPISLDNAYHTTAQVESHLSPYKWFCPYSWSVHSDLLDQRNNQRYGAFYLGKYYFFSSDAFLQRFLIYPSEVTVSPGFKPLPSVIPSRVQPGKEYQLEFLGCCPVTLYNTRENKGLRGVLEPVALKGDPHCVVEYDGRYYALLDESSLEHFMMRPWQYVEGANLPSPRKVPLPKGQTLSTISEYEFVRRSLYDPVAHALIAVAEARPKYPGLSVEESALKFMALHMKSFNEKNSTIQANQYRENFELFRKRSTLYRTMTQITDIEASGEEFSNLCAEWEQVINEEEGKVSSFVHLRSDD